MVTGQEHLGNLTSTKDLRPRVMGIFQQSLGVAFFKQRFLVDDTIQQSVDRIDDDQGRRLSRGQHVIPY